jgi:hypothetical protein
MRAEKALLALLLAGVLSACGGANGAAQSTADSVTKAVYANDADSMTANFEPSLKATVTRGEVGTLSDKMHKLGDYKGLTLLSNDLTKNEFTFRADFSNGSMKIIERLDSTGKVSAYRVFPTAST